MMTTAARLLSFVAGLVLAMPALAAEPPAGFAAKASVANLFEMQASELALKRSQDGDVKELARLILADHQKAQRDLVASARNDGIGLAQQLDAGHLTRLKGLKAQRGDKFDKAWLNAQADVHTEALALFGDYSANGANGALKTYATATLPALQSHMQRVHDFTVR